MKMKNTHELLNSVQSMAEIEEKLNQKRLKHDLVLSEICMDVRNKNMQREMQTTKFKQSQEFMSKVERDNMEKSLLQTNHRLAKKGKEALKMLKEIKQKH